MSKNKNTSLMICLLLLFLVCGIKRNEDNRQLSVEQIVSSPSVSPELFQVQNDELSDQVIEVESMFEGIVSKEYSINGIPVLEVSKKELERKQPIMVYLHGVTGCKEQNIYILCQLASQGFRAICIDLPGHGERNDGAFMFLDVIEQACKDLDTVLSYLDQNVYPVEHFGLGGFSAGAMITYMYTIRGNYKPSIIVPISGVADWRTIVDSDLIQQCYEYSKYVEPTKDADSIKKQLYEYNPYNDLEEIASIPVIISHGYLDTTFPYQIEEQLCSDLRILGDSEVELYLYSVGHESVPSFYGIMYEALAERLFD